MAVLPPDSDLQHEVQIIKPDGDRHLDAADHRRRHLVDLDAQARDLGHAHRPVIGLVMPGSRPRRLVCGAGHPRPPYALHIHYVDSLWRQAFRAPPAMTKNEALRG
jgi:hypothetical protein